MGRAGRGRGRRRRPRGGVRVALTELASGRYPYTATTYLGNPITPLPGALLLAAPFWWVTGSAAWQNVAWTLLLLPVLNGGFRLRPAPTALWVLAVLGGLEVLREFLVTRQRGRVRR